MPKCAAPQTRDPEQPQAPNTAAAFGTPDVPPPPDGGNVPEESLRKGNAVILTMGDGIPSASPAQQRRALIATANAGDADARSRMGDICRTGDDLTEQDYSEALRWYRLASEQGDRNAENNFGAMHQHGMGTAKDMTEAARWYRKAADRGLPSGQYNLAMFLINGEQTREDLREAAAWLRKAANQGHIASIAQLGTLYQLGGGVERLICNAAEYHVIAALAGDEQSSVRLGSYRGELEQEALGGRMLAALCLAKMYDRGLGVEESKPMMYAWLLWGEKFGNRNEDPDVLEELLDMRGFYGIVLADADKDDALDLLKGLAAKRSRADASETDPCPPLRRQRSH